MNDSCGGLSVSGSKLSFPVPTSQVMERDSNYFHRRAAEARAEASAKGRAEEAAVSGELALAYAALARRRAAADSEAIVAPMPAAELA
jgi:hypothetical protein